MEKERVLQIIREMENIFDWIPGSCRSYDENTADFYNPIKAGMDFQRLKDLYQELKETLKIARKYDSHGYGMRLEYMEEE